jgi:hypothetical protein
MSNNSNNNTSNDVKQIDEICVKNEKNIKKCEIGRHRFEYEPLDDDHSDQLNSFQHLFKSFKINFKK